MPGCRSERSPARCLAALGLALSLTAPAAAQGRGHGGGSSRPLPAAGAAARAYGQIGGTAPYPGTLLPPAVTGNYNPGLGFNPGCYPYNPCYPSCPTPVYVPYPVYGGYGLGYPGYYASANFGGLGVAVGLPATQQVVIDRRVYVVPQGATDAPLASPDRGGTRANGGSQNDGQLRPVPPSDSAPAAPKGDGFYLTRPGAAEALGDALKDIRRAWLNGDYLRLKDRFTSPSGIRLFPGGKYTSTMTAADFGKMTRDALQAIETTAFELEPATMSSPDRAFVAGKHTFAASPPDGGPKRAASVFISYTLELKDGLWRITEAGSSSEPITSHAGG